MKGKTQKGQGVRSKRPAKKKTSGDAAIGKIRASKKSPAEKVGAARIAASVLRSHGGWVPPSAEFVRTETKLRLLINEDTGEIVHQETTETVDRTKLDKLLEILEPFRIPEIKQKMLLQRAQFAVEDFYLSQNQSRAGEDSKRKWAIERLERLSKAAREFSQAWADLGHDLQRSLTCHIEGRFPTANSKAQARTIVERHAQTARIESVATDDSWALISGARTLIEALESDNSHEAAEYACALSIGRAWQEFLDVSPTATRNKDACSGPQRTPFQRFMDEALSPLKIGDGVIRMVIQALKIGDTSA